MKFIPKKELLFALCLAVPIALFTIGNLLGSDSIRTLSAFAAIPILLIFAFAFVANFRNVASSKTDPERRRRHCADVLNTLQSSPNLILTVEPPDGSKFAVRFTEGRFVLANSGGVTTQTPEELLSILSAQASRLSLSAAES